MEKAVKAGKSIYCEKPTAVETSEALRLARLCESAKLKNGVVQDKLWLPGMRKIQMLKQQGFFGKILSVRVAISAIGFSPVTCMTSRRSGRVGTYRLADGGGIMVDMFCHWQYVISNLFGKIKSVVAYGRTDIPERVGEDGKPYPATADDSAYAIFVLEDGMVCQFNSSWCVRVRRDDLLTVQVDGTSGSAVAGLREAWVQGISETPKPVWNPDIPQPIDFNKGWQQIPNSLEYDNAFKIQWELFLKHVAIDTPFRWTLREGAKGVQLAEIGMKSWKERKWFDVPEMES